MTSFWGRVEMGDDNECWEWAGGHFSEGYGAVVIDGKTRLTHRVAYEKVVGQIPDGLGIDHLCRNRGCCNPSHLEAVTTRVNVLRGVGVTAENARKTHCIHGHEFTPENTRVRPGRGRECWTCHRERTRDYKAKLRAA